MFWWDEQNERPRFGRIGGAVVGILFALVFSFGSCYSVEAGERAVQTRFGSVVGISDPGLHAKIPIVDDIETISTRTAYLDWAKTQKADGRMEAYSHDQQPAMMSVRISFHVKGDDESIRRLFIQYRNADGLNAAVISPRAGQAIKTAFGQFTAVSVVQNRAEFNAKALRAVEDLVYAASEGKPSLAVIDGVQIYDITFSETYIHAVEQRMQAQVEVEKVTQNLERTRKEAEMRVVQAQADAQAVKLRGEAEASAIRARADALRSNPSLVDLTAVEKWNGTLPQTMVPSGTVPFLDLHGGRR